MAADYTTIADVKQYNNSNQTTNDALLAELITAMSREIDAFINQGLAETTLANATYNAVIDGDGLLTCYPPFNQVNSVTSFAWKMPFELAYNSLSTTMVEIENQPNGSIVRYLDPSFICYRQSVKGRLKIQLSGDAGYPVSTVVSSGSNISQQVAQVPKEIQLACNRLVVWKLKQKSAGDNDQKTAMPALGQVIIPMSWPVDVSRTLSQYVNYYHS